MMRHEKTFLEKVGEGGRRDGPKNSWLLLKKKIAFENMLKKPLIRRFYGKCARNVKSNTTQLLISL